MNRTISRWRTALMTAIAATTLLFAGCSKDKKESTEPSEEEVFNEEAAAEELEEAGEEIEEGAEEVEEEVDEEFDDEDEPGDVYEGDDDGR